MPNVTSFAFGSSTLAMVFLQCTLLDLLHVPLRKEAVYVKPLCFEECLRTQDGTWHVKNHDPAVNAANTKGEGGTTLRPQVASEGSTLTASKPPAGQCCYNIWPRHPCRTSHHQRLLSKLPSVHPGSRQVSWLPPIFCSYPSPLMDTHCRLHASFLCRGVFLKPSQSKWQIANDSPSQSSCVRDEGAIVITLRILSRGILDLLVVSGNFGHSEAERHPCSS